MERRGARKKPPVKDLNAHLLCSLCEGYFVDAYTIVECIHSFCRSCILRHLQTNKFCPTCQLPVNLSKNSDCVKPDTSLQGLVYKTVPIVYQTELLRRKAFYTQSCYKHMAPSTLNYGLGNDYFSPEDSISLSLQYYTELDYESSDDGATTDSEATNKLIPQRRYLQCPAAVSMKHLKKFIRLKYGLSPEYLVDMIYSKECLPDDFTLMDVAYTFSWRRTSPMRFHYRIFEKPTFSRSVNSISHTVKKHDSKSVASKSVNKNCSSSPTENSVPSHEHTIGTMSEESPTKKLRISCESSEEVSCTTTSIEVPLKAAPPATDKQVDIKPEPEKVCIDNKHCEATPKSLTFTLTSNVASEDERNSITCDTKEDISKVESTVTSSVCEATAPDKSEKTTQETKKHAERSNKKVDVEMEVEKVKNNLKRRAPSEEDEGSSRSTEHEKKHKDEKEHSGRKKDKHKYKYFKSLGVMKRSIIVTPTILHNPDDVMKLKVKLNPVPVIPNSHHHKHHHHSKHHHSKHHKSSSDSSSNPSATFSTNKERLLQMRAVRHKTNKQARAEKSPEEIFQKQKASLLVPPSSITVSKVPSSDKRTSDLNKLSGASNGIENKRPSLEIMLVSSKKSSSAASVQGKGDEGKKGNSETSAKVSRPLPASIPLVRTSKQSVTAIKPPLGLTITPKITTKHEETSSKSHLGPTKANASLAKGKKYTESVTSSKVQDLKFQEKPSSPKLPDGTLKLPENGCKEQGVGPIPASMRHDNCGALDLSGKSSRKSDTSSPIPIPEVLPLPNANIKSTPSILAIAQNLVHKQLSSSQGLSGDNNTHGSTVPVPTGTSNATPSSGMSNLKTLSDTAVRIRNLMAAETKAPSPTSTSVVTTANNHSNTNNNGKGNNGNCSPNRNFNFNNNNHLKGSPVKAPNTSPYPAGSTLRIPVPQTTLKYPAGRGLPNRPSIPRLNEIVSRGRGGRGMVPLASTKPGPNLGVRHIPNPSALFRQQSINKNINGKAVTSSTNDSGSGDKTMFNGTGSMLGQSQAPTGSSLTVTAAPIRKIENMTRNIEKVAAGLTVRAVEANGAPKLT